MIRGLALREINTRSIAASLSVFSLAGIAAGLVAAGFPSATSGSATLVTRFDRTLIGVIGWISVFRTISRLTSDARSDWLLQLAAAGAPRELYVAAVALAVAALSVLAYIAGALSFTLTLLARTAQLAPLMRVAHDLPLVPLPTIAASAFGAAVVCVIGHHMAGRVAFVLMAAPWIALWLTLATRGQLDASASYVRWLDYPLPRLYVSATLANISYMAVYIGAAFGLIMTTAGWRIGRRT